MKLKQRPVAVLAIAVAALCLAIAGVVIGRVEHALGGSARDLAGKQQLFFSVLVLAPQPNPGFEGMPAPAVFKGGAAFDGHFYLSGPAGLFSYSTRSLPAWWATQRASSSTAKPRTDTSSFTPRGTG